VDKYKFFAIDQKGRFFCPRRWWSVNREKIYQSGLCASKG